MGRAGAGFRAGRRGRVAGLLAAAALALLLAAQMGVGAAKVKIGDAGYDEEDPEDLAMWGLPSARERMDRLDAKRDAPMEANVDLDRLRDTEYIQTMTLRNIRSPTITFIKLRPDANRTMEDAEALGKSWTEFARSGQVSAQFYGAGPDQLVVVVEDGAAAVKLRDFILSQPEAYEWEVERQQFRRAGDPPFDQLPEVAAERRERERLDEVRRNTAAWRRRQGDGGGGAAGEL